MVRGRLACMLYRIAHHAYRWHIPVLPVLLFHLNAVLNGCEIHYAAEIGPGLAIAHPHGVVIGRGVRVGRFFKIYSGAVLGVQHIGKGDQPTIGDHVVVYAGAKILGTIHVGNRAVVGANAVVVRDVEPYAIVGGVPARVIGRVPCPETALLIDWRQLPPLAPEPVFDAYRH